MSEVREIVTRAVLAKGKKIFRIHDLVTLGQDAYSILGCWVINHCFDATLNDKTVTLNGNFEISGYNEFSIKPVPGLPCS